MRVDDKNTLRELYDKLLNSNGYIIKNRVDEIYLSKSVLDRNFIELAQYIKEYETNEEIFSNGRLNRDYKNEIVRLLQNYVASDYTYSEHVQRVVEYLGDEELLSNFYTRRTELRQDENVSFVRDLRRYSQHCGIIRQSTRMQFTRVTMEEPIFHSTTSVELTKASLGEWKDWKSKSKTFIRNMDDQIKLIIPLARQLKKINEFHNWIIEKILTRFEQPIGEYHQILDAIIKLQGDRKTKRGRKNISHVEHLGASEWVITEDEEEEEF